MRVNEGPTIPDRDKARFAADRAANSLCAETFHAEVGWSGAPCNDFFPERTHPAP